MGRTTSTICRQKSGWGAPLEEGNRRSALHSAQFASRPNDAAPVKKRPASDQISGASSLPACSWPSQLLPRKARQAATG
jgi:hypothetical protein